MVRENLLKRKIEWLNCIVCILDVGLKMLLLLNVFVVDRNSISVF